MEKSAYIFSELDRSMGEGRRLSTQALAFVDLELPELMKKIPEDAKIADFGCGTGVISSALAHYMPKATVVGLDPDERARELAAQLGFGIPNLSFENYGFGQEGLPVSGPFDVAFTRLVLLHLKDPAAAVAQMGRCLKPGGLLYLVDCDDDYDNFYPEEPWQAELIALMKKSQGMRGGTRTLGSQLLKLAQSQGFWPEGSRALYYSTEELGRERWKEIFLPALGGMADRDLKYLREQGALEGEKMNDISERMRNFFERPDSRAQVSTWHAWARKY
jgi:SAM-dependent methyltransferase